MDRRWQDRGHWQVLVAGTGFTSPLGAATERAAMFTAASWGCKVRSHSVPRPLGLGCTTRKRETAGLETRPSAPKDLAKGPDTWLDGS